MATKDISDRTVCFAYEEVRLRKLEIKKSLNTIEWFEMINVCEYPYEILQKITGQPEKVCYRAMERAADRGYVEYGVSLRTGWLTGVIRRFIWEDKYYGRR